MVVENELCLTLNFTYIDLFAGCGGLSLGIGESKLYELRRSLRLIYDKQVKKFTNLRSNIDLETYDDTLFR